MSRRRSGGRSPYPRVLIVTEGSETEPTYFRDLCADPKFRLTSVDVDGASDSNPMAVVDHGLERFEEDGDYDRLYCVFDRDRRKEFDRAVKWLENMRENEGWSVYWTFSVPCFEYWILLHYENTASTYNHPDSPCSQVVRDVREHLPEYGKGMQGLYDKTKPNLEDALDRSRERWQAAQNTGSLNPSLNPSTLVHRLVSYLQDIRSWNRISLSGIFDTARGTDLTLYCFREGSDFPA
jgi:hypothetical protein